MNMKGNNGKIVSMGTGLHKNVSNAEISTKNYVLCSFKMEKGPVFRILPCRVDFWRIRYLYYYLEISEQSKILESKSPA